MIRCVLALGVIAPACGGAEETERAEASAHYGRAFSLSLGERARVDERMTIGFARVAQDSRCDDGADCPSAGNVAAVFTLDDRAGSATLTLHTGREPRRAVAAGHEVRLLGVRPDAPPRDSVDYSATLVVTPSR